MSSKHTSQELKEWIDGIRANSKISIAEKPVNQLEKWQITATGEIVHETREFFKILGVSVRNSEREVAGWDQPMVWQKEMGILGILCCKLNGSYHYLLNAKFEPGNIFGFQISPTLQATYSNLKRAHGGRKPEFFDYFIEEDRPGQKTLYKQWLAEDGGRFYLKSNLNMLVEVGALADKKIPHDFRWFTLEQVKEFLRFDNYINPHVRSILCHL